MTVVFVRALAASAALLLAALGALLFAAPAHAADPAATALDRTEAAPAAPAPVRRAQEGLRRGLGPHALLQSDRATATPRIVARLDGHLTSASPRDAEAIALGYVGDHLDAFGLDGTDLATLRLVRRSRGADGTVHLAWEQRVDGLPSVDGGLQAAVDADGRLVNVRGGAAPDPVLPPGGPAVTAAGAYAIAEPSSAGAPAAGPPRGAERQTAFASGGSASLVLYRDGGRDRLGWRVLAPAGSSAFYDAIVDARTGRLQRRVNRVHSARVNPRQPGDSMNTEAMSDAWLDGGTGLSGPFAHAISDLEDRIYAIAVAGGYGLSASPESGDEVPANSGSGPSREWIQTANLGFCGAARCSWDSDNRLANRRYSTAQLFWYVNRFRDHLAADPIGFNGAGAFAGDDRVLAQALDGASTNSAGSTPDASHLSNANMLVLPDGFPGLMQMYLFGPADRYDGAMDASVAYHEYAHGLSGRLVTDAQGFGALAGAQAGAVAEGTSDFYAMDFLVASEPGLVPDTATQGELQLGKWLQTNPSLKGAAAIRTEGLDCPAQGFDAARCPGLGAAGPGGYDYADLGRVLGAPEVHADGEIWAQTLWSLRRALIVAHGTGEGLARTREYVTDGLRLAPEDPSFLDMRNAIVQAAVTHHGTEDWTRLWQEFAARGMGWSASTTDGDDVSPLPAGDVPPPPGSGARGAVTGAITDESGAPVGGVTVSAGGHDSGLSSTDLLTTSAADGSYALGDLPAGGYGDLYFRRPGFEELTRPVQLAAGELKRIDVTPLRRDYASLASGSVVAAFNGPNYAGQGCGPQQALDDDRGTVWSTTTADGPHDLIIDLGRSVDLRSVRIDPHAGCGDGPGASLHQYELAASDGNGAPFEPLAGGTIGPLDARGFALLPLAGDLGGRRLLRLRAIAPRAAGERFMDVAELEVTGTPLPPAPPPAAPPAAPAPAPARAAPLVTVRSRRVTASRRGALAVKVRFAANAPRGTARLQLRGKRRKLLAGARTRVRRGRTVTVRMRLNRAGRSAIRPGRRARVTLSVILPGGKLASRRITVARRRR